ncbi:MAG: hypothetical protein VYD87_07920 [Pseudomonadota bacterium]|nr:hypothetical protein [Pseudomonadota bacterium]
MDRVTPACPAPRTPRPRPGFGIPRPSRLLTWLVAAACLAGALGAPAAPSAQEAGRPAGRPDAAFAPVESLLVQGMTGPQGGAMCGERRQVVSRLAEKYGETRRGYGLQQGAAVVEVFASGSTGSWTILLSTPNGLACLLAAGQNWAPTPDESSGPVGDPT